MVPRTYLPQHRGQLQRPTSALKFFHQLLRSKIPFVLVRFSDGETEILKNERLRISNEGVVWSKGTFANLYPLYDFKDFDPKKDIQPREDLIDSATFTGDYYLEGRV